FTGSFLSEAGVKSLTPSVLALTSALLSAGAAGAPASAAGVPPASAPLTGEGSATGEVSAGEGSGRLGGAPPTSRSVFIGRSLQPHFLRERGASCAHLNISTPMRPHLQTRVAAFLPGIAGRGGRDRTSLRRVFGQTRSHTPSEREQQ